MVTHVVPVINDIACGCPILDLHSLFDCIGHEEPT